MLDHVGAQGHVGPEGHGGTEDRVSGLGYRQARVSTAPYETRMVPLLPYAGVASGRHEAPRARLGQ